MFSVIIKQLVYRIKNKLFQINLNIKYDDLIEEICMFVVNAGIWLQNMHQAENCQKNLMFSHLG